MITTRSAIIRKAKERLDAGQDAAGICVLLRRTINNYFFLPRLCSTKDMPNIFPLLKRNEAIKRCNNTNEVGDYWWGPNDWSGGRMQFFNWLYEQYKDDETEVEL